MGYLDLLNLLGDPRPPAKLGHQIPHSGKLGHVDMIVCSAGVFENAPLYRAQAFAAVEEALGVKIDEKLNAETRLGKEGIISSKDSKVPVVVIPTDEELMIALDTARVLGL